MQQFKRMHINICKLESVHRWMSPICNFLHPCGLLRFLNQMVLEFYDKIHVHDSYAIYSYVQL
jgi:hypothetical protein